MRQTQNNFLKKHRKRLLFLIPLLILCAIAYALADRYLIDHVEVTVVSASAPVNRVAESIPATTVPVTYDDWNYQSADATIAISKVKTGSGADTVTYYVADVTVSEGADILNAFANNQYGTNIIAPTSTIAENNNAIFAINGDYYGFRKDGIIIRNGVIYRDVPARIGLAFYQDGTMQIYDEKTTSAAELLADGVWNTLSFGPALVDDSIMVTDFGVTQVDTNFGNHTIQGNNPRTGIGMIAPNHYVFVVVDGRSTGYSRGVTLAEFAQIFADLGCSEAYNIDGGGSSVMYFMGKVVNNPLGRNRERGTSDILYIAG